MITQKPNLVPSLILLGAAVVPTAFVTFVSGRRLDLRHRHRRGRAGRVRRRRGRRRRGRAAGLRRAVAARRAAEAGRRGLTTAALWYAAEHRRSPRALLRLAGVYLFAVVLHTIWDNVGSLTVYPVLAVVSLGLLTWFAHRLQRSRSPSTSR